MRRATTGGHGAMDERTTDRSSIGEAELLLSLVLGERLTMAVPAALGAVERDALATAGCFPGDLLRGLMEVPGGFWSRHPKWYDRYRAAVRHGAQHRARRPEHERMAFWEPLDVPTIVARARGRAEPPES